MAETCAIVVCDHGLGHVRRCALMAKERERTGEQVTLFAPRSSVERLQRVVPSITGLTVSDFATRTTPERVREGLPVVIEWLDRLPNLDGFDTVICDNLPEILARRPDATISAQFFWHDVIEGAADNYTEYCEELLERYKPIVIGSGLFAMESVRHRPNFLPSGLYATEEMLAAAADSTLEWRNGLLITGGSTQAAHQQCEQVISKLLKAGIAPFRQAYVDPEIIPEDPPRWMVKANFSVEMYRKIGVGICRPGLGVITDLLTIGAWPVAAYEKRNREMKHNASVLKTHGLGDESDTDHVIDIAKTHMENTLARRKFIEKRCELLGLDMRVY